MIGPVNATEYTAPEVPESATEYMPEDPETFGEGLWHIIKEGLAHLQPSLTEAGSACFSVIACILLASILKNFSDSSKNTVSIVTTLCVAFILLRCTNALINYGINTVEKLTEYGKLLLPVMTSALAAEGGLTSSTALYTGTALFNSLLASAMKSIIVPMLYIYLVLKVALRTVGNDILNNLHDLLKWLITWSIKIVLYVFTGYLGITGVVSGTTDAAALKATKLTISGVVPVVGNIISDASESILVSAGLVKNSIGIYGLLAVTAIWIGPFIRIGSQYLLLKATAALCGGFGAKEPVNLIKDFSEIMGFLVAMTGAVCILLLVSIICYMKGVG